MENLRGVANSNQRENLLDIDSDPYLRIKKEWFSTVEGFSSDSPMMLAGISKIRAEYDTLLVQAVNEAKNRNECSSKDIEEYADICADVAKYYDLSPEAVSHAIDEIIRENRTIPTVSTLEN